MIKRIFSLPFFAIALFAIVSFIVKEKDKDDEIISYTVDLNQQNLEFFWKDEKRKTLKSIQNLKDHVNKNNQTLLFAMNGGMYKGDRSPQGLFIQNQVELAPLDTSSGKGNFYMMPNGVFFVTTSNKAQIVETKKFENKGQVKNATQSGPMLVIDGNIHSAFKQGSKNLNIRNGVGVLPDNKVVFAMSKKEINFYDFANYFKGLGCSQALYLDGFVSRMYLPEKNWIQTDGNFGVMIAVVK